MKEKGFTLVELLAVIVILAIILAVAVPSIANIVNSATMGSFKSDAKMVLTAIDYEKLKDENFVFTTIDENNIADMLKLSAANYESITVTIVDEKPYLIIIGKGKWAGYTVYGKADNMRVVNSNDYDVTIPIITLIGTTPITIEAGSVYNDAGATASDDKDGDITSKMTISSNMNANVVGTYTVTYNVTDNNGNKATTLTRTINVVDAAAPVIIMNGTTPVTVIQNGTYSDAGATATDNVDGDLTSNIVTVSTVNTTSVGTYTVTYNVKDNANNSAVQITRTVNVVDTTPPVIMRTGATPVIVPQGATYTDAGATATDNADGNITGRIVVVNPINTSVIGTYTVTYNVKDNANNSATQVTRTVNVVYSTYTFTNAAAIGQLGPTQAQLNTAYAGTTLAGTVTSTSGIQTWTVPYTATYRIEIYGAESGAGTYSGTNLTGKGARMRGDFSLTAGTVLSIAIGQKGDNSTGSSYNGPGGGGGTFVIYSGNPAIIAGGGGASGAYSGYSSGATQTGGNGLTTTSGGPSYRGGLGGTSGAGGTASIYRYSAGAGGGYTGNGQDSNAANPLDGGYGGKSYSNGLAGGAKASSFPAEAGSGGFGGGGGGSPIAGGGGGGYSGGCGSNFNADTQADGGGGGGSYNSGTNPSNTAGTNTGSGKVIITIMP